MKKLALALLLALSASPALAERIDLTCLPTFEQPREKNDPVSSISVTLWTDPQDIQVIHHARSGDYSRGSQYLATLQKASPLDWRWDGVFAANRNLTMKGRLLFSDTWHYNEMLFDRGVPNYRMESTCTKD